jgi:hypothetical protein
VAFSPGPTACLLSQQLPASGCPACPNAASAWGTNLKGADAQYWKVKQGCAHMVLFFQEGG